jgi:hypothetical protein
VRTCRATWRRTSRTPRSGVAYGFPTRQLQPIAGLVAFYNEKVDLFLFGQRLERPKTHFFAPADSPGTP